MSLQVQTSALTAASPMDFAAKMSSEPQKTSGPLTGGSLKSGWWLVPFLASGSAFWVWFIPTVAKTVI
jgi:hypothetical protein